MTATSARSLRSLDRDPTAPIRNLDWALLGLALVLNAIGAAMIYSATKGSDAHVDTTYLGKEILFVLLSMGVLAVAALIRYDRIQRWAPAIYILTLLSLAGVLAVGSSRKGAQAWFAFGPLQLQPSEPAKVASLAARLSFHFGSSA